MRQPLVALVSSAAVLITPWAVTAPASATPSSVPATLLAPAALPRGEAVTLPHVRGRTIVDGHVRIPVEAARVTMIGRSGTAYVVNASGADGLRRLRTLRVDADGSTTVLVRGADASEFNLSDDGEELVRSTVVGHRRTRVTVQDVRVGPITARRVFRGFARVLDQRGNDRLITTSSPNRTFWWSTGSDTLRPVSRRFSHAADIDADRLAAYTGDPYRGGCTVVTRVTRPRTVLWRSCDERVDSFSPSGRRMSTVGILSDGIGPSMVLLRRTHGRLLARYTTRGWFGAVTWETGTRLLLDTNGRSRAATVRCVVKDCERASGLRPVEDL